MIARISWIALVSSPRPTDSLFAFTLAQHCFLAIIWMTLLVGLILKIDAVPASESNALTALVINEFAMFANQSASSVYLVVFFSRVLALFLSRPLSRLSPRSIPSIPEVSRPWRPSLLTEPIVGPLGSSSTSVSESQLCVVCRSFRCTRWC